MGSFKSTTVVLGYLTIAFVALNISAVLAENIKGRFLHITDLHVDALYRSHADPELNCHRSSSNDSSANISGDLGVLSYLCDTSFLMSNATFAFLKANLADSIDFIIYTGDTGRHDRDKQNPRTKDEVLNQHRDVVKYFQDTFDLNKIKFIPTLGNNDLFEHDIIEPGPTELFTSIYDIWKPLNLTLGDTWTKGGYFRQDVNGISIYSLNTLYFYKKNTKVNDCNDTSSPGAQQISWLRGELNDAKSSGRKVYLMGHVPPQPSKTNGDFYHQCLQDYSNLLGNFADVILGHFTGHTNQDTITLIMKSKTDGNYTAHTLRDATPPNDVDTNDIVLVTNNAPSLVPAYNPAFRVFNYSTDQSTSTDSKELVFGTLLDYVQFCTDITKDNQIGHVQWDIEYDAQASYGLKALTTAEWRNAIENFKKNSTEWQAYVKHINTTLS